VAKTDTTKQIEALLFERYFLKKSERCALEPSTFGKWTNREGREFFKGWSKRCDFVSFDKGDIFTFIEIKVSLSDFKSKNGHNFNGDKNYYAIPVELFEKVNELTKYQKHIGIIVLDDGKLYVKRNAKSVEESKLKKFKLVEQQKKEILTACNTRIYRYLNKAYK
jgi:hypothetical protein